MVDYSHISFDDQLQLSTTARKREYSLCRFPYFDVVVGGITLNTHNFVTACLSKVLFSASESSLNALFVTIPKPVNNPSR